MNANAVNERKEKFNRYKMLRENPEELLSPVIKPAQSYSARDRILDTVDAETFEEFRFEFPETNPLEFEGYVEIEGHRAVIVVMDKHFMMASMGMELGEIVCQSAEYASEHKLPLIIFTASGGARMQEGILSLMQMAKTSAVIEHFKNEGGLYIAVLTHPTTGGVSASFATLGDITIAEKGALVGFAGPRVIEQTIGQKLPEGFQRAEFLEEHGFVDAVVERDEVRTTLARILKLHVN